jgi:hypothetical protein
MAAQKIPLETLQKIRQYLKTALVLPESENHPKSWSVYNNGDEPPEPESLSELGELFHFGGMVEAVAHAPNREGQWFISSTNPGTAVLKLPGLKLKSNLRLVTYLYRTPNQGVGVTWAVPEELSITAQLEKALANSGDRAHPPQPIGACDDVMAAIEGDRSPLSFAVASLLRRELREFGALGQACSWSHHRLIQTPPAQASWQWRVEMPKSLAPKLLLFPNGRAAIEFFTCRVTPPIAIFQHVDQYPDDSYKAACVDRAVAIAQRLP